MSVEQQRATAPLFVAIDTPDSAAAAALAGRLAALPGIGIKLGLELFCSAGPPALKAVAAAAPGVPLFLDLKFHDIPNTVAGAVRSVAPLAPALLTLHASGGPEMLRAAVAAAAEGAAAAGVPRPRLLAVTVLTSLDDADLAAVGQSTPAQAQVVRLATMAQAAGVDGVVCSAREIGPIREACGPDFLLVVPGIRPAGAAVGDQKRVVTPGEAMRAGASALVVGRPISQADSPPDAAAAILDEIREAEKAAATGAARVFNDPADADAALAERRSFRDPAAADADLAERRTFHDPGAGSTAVSDARAFRDPLGK